MDEPFGALDAVTRDDLNLELTRIWQGSEKSILFITHSIAEAVYLSDVVAMMSRGPARIVDVINIELPRPRPLSMRETPEFGAYVSRIRHHFAQLGILKERPASSDARSGGTAARATFSWSSRRPSFSGRLGSLFSNRPGSSSRRPP